jgi:hypothetical protein
MHRGRSLGAASFSRGVDHKMLVGSVLKTVVRNTAPGASRNTKFQGIFVARAYSSSKPVSFPSENDGSKQEEGVAWRKRQLQKLEERFEFQAWPEYEVQNIKSDDELQPTWKGMESRVTKRMAPLTKEELRTRGKSAGRSNVKKTEEEEWLKAGAYDLIVDVTPRQD